jgi:UV DNA damage endonuclease
MPSPLHPYRLGFAVKVLGAGGLPSSDTRRWQSGPHLSRSLDLLEPVLDHLEAHDVRVYRMSSSLVPYGTHPDLPELDYRRQIGACEERLAAIGARARAAGMRLSTHPGQYTVINSPDAELAAKARMDLEQDALLLDAMGQGPEAVVVIHVGGVYGDRPSALDRWARSYAALSEAARARVVVEHDETSFDLADVLELHRRTGVRVIYDHHHHRCNPAPALREPRDALAAACATWPAGVRPKVHLSSARTELRLVKRTRPGTRRAEEVAVLPRLDAHADVVMPWDLAELLAAAPGPLDVMLEAKAKDLAVAWLRTQLARVAPELAAAEER